MTALLADFGWLSIFFIIVAVLLAVGARLGAGSPHERRAALGVLTTQTELPTALAEPLRRLVEDDDTAIRRQAARALALLPATTRVGDLGIGVIPIALAFALPSLLVSLHARSRSRDERERATLPATNRGGA